MLRISCSRVFQSAHAIQKSSILSRSYVANQQANSTRPSNKTIMPSSKKTDVSTETMGHRMKEAGKNATYTGVVLVGVGVAGLLFYFLWNELCSRESPNGIYSEALKICKDHGQVIDLVGEPMKGFGETTSRGRRRHISHMEYEQNGQKFMQMKFYVSGPKDRATVTLQVKKNDQGRYEYDYLIVQTRFEQIRIK